MQAETRRTILIGSGLFLLALLGFWWYTGFSLGFMRFFAAEPNPTPVPVYRASTTNGDHVLTADQNEYNTLGTRGWSKEGVAFQAFSAAATYNGVTLVPLYRLYNATILQHLYTTDANENRVLSTQGWSAEGTTAYVLPTQATGTVPLYRLLRNPVHLLTADANEKNTLVSNGWTNEGVVGYALPTAERVACQPRPACLDSNPPCEIAEPIGGWCPQQSKHVECDPATQTVKVNLPAELSPKGPSGDGLYKWFAPGGFVSDGHTGGASVLTPNSVSVTYTTPGIKEVTVLAPRGDGSANVDSVACTVIVNP